MLEVSLEIYALLYAAFGEFWIEEFPVLCILLLGSLVREVERWRLGDLLVALCNASAWRIRINVGGISSSLGAQIHVVLHGKMEKPRWIKNGRANKACTCKQQPCVDVLSCLGKDGP